MIKNVKSCIARLSIEVESRSSPSGKRLRNAKIERLQVDVLGENASTTPCTIKSHVKKQSLRVRATGTPSEISVSASQS